MLVGLEYEIALCIRIIPSEQLNLNIKPSTVLPAPPDPIQAEYVYRGPSSQDTKTTERVQIL